MPSLPMAIDLLVPLKLRTNSENTSFDSVSQELVLVPNSKADPVGYIYEVHRTGSQKKNMDVKQGEIRNTDHHKRKREPYENKLKRVFILLPLTLVKRIL